MVDTGGGVSINCERNISSQVKLNSWCKFLDNLIGWMLANAGEVTLNLNLSQLKRHHKAQNNTLAGTSVILWTHIKSPTKMYQYLYTHTCNNQPPTSTHKM